MGERGGEINVQREDVVDICPTFPVGVICLYIRSGWFRRQREELGRQIENENYEDEGYYALNIWGFGGHAY